MYRQTTRTAHLEDRANPKPTRQPTPRYHHPWLKTLTVPHLEAREGWYHDHPGEALPLDVAQAIVDAASEDGSR